jgi:putative glutamine amidotransferase
MEVKKLKKPTIGLVSSIMIDNNTVTREIERVYVNHEYVEAIEKAGGVPIILSIVNDDDTILSQMQLCDGLVFTGGMDIHPKMYKEQCRESMGFFHSKVDTYQMKLMGIALEHDIPSLCICRGHQLLNVICGGSLYQDNLESNIDSLKHVQNAKRSESCHTVKLVKGSIVQELFGDELWVNSFHHQSINRLGNNLSITAVAPDGIIEGIQHDNKTFFIGVQWHPEMLLRGSNDMLVLFNRLISTSIK